ncbi:hypothetical protein G5C65_37990, partial [Streptomyces sp. SB3404]|nr:hypothetical protein [Streptomyces boncukensis]
AGPGGGREGARASAGWIGGALAVVSAGLGLASLTGTSLSEMLRERKQLIGQIESSAQSSQGSGSEAVDAAYGAPWHAAAAINGVVAALAVALGAVLLALTARSADTRTWVKAVAAGGVVLGVLGLLVAGGMYFDLFADQPSYTPQQTPGQ